MSKEVSFTFPAPVSTESDQVVEALKRRAAMIPLAALEVETHCNGEADSFHDTWPTSFSKGLEHNTFGIVTPYSYTSFFAEITDPSYTDNAGNRIALFDLPAYCGTFQTQPHTDGGDFGWRDWDMPFPDQQLVTEVKTVALPPAPGLGSDELAAEMAELYAMAHLRDHSFEDLRSSKAAEHVALALSNMAWFDPKQTPTDANGNALDSVSSCRRVRDGEGLTSQTLFRGASAGCADGPYVSQFLLQGATSEDDANLTERDGFIPNSAEPLDQRITAPQPGVDYLRDWAEWLDVQNGANTKRERATFEGERKFIETPRDLATLACADASCDTYLNAILLLMNWGTACDPGLPDDHAQDRFASLEKSYLLSLVTETAARAHRASWRQKFQVHNRARPEKLGSVACLIENGYGAELGAAEAMASRHLDKLDTAYAEGFDLVEAIVAAPSERRFKHVSPSWRRLPEITRNLLLPMTCPEGSPMHPSYGAGHAAVAGACVTMIKAFFRTHDADRTPMSLRDAGAPEVCVPEAGGLALAPAQDVDTPETLTLNGELNKLAENLSLAGCMAGVHYYSDCFEGLRMGERIAVGILSEQMVAFSQDVTMTLETFDGDMLTVSGNGRGDADIRVHGCSLHDWWTRHLPPQTKA